MVEKEDSPKDESLIMVELNKDIVVRAITSILTEIYNENMDSSKTKLIEAQKSNAFFSKKVPSISIQAYFDRIMKYTKMDDTTLVIVLIYIDKLCESSNFLLTENNIHR